MSIFPITNIQLPLFLIVLLFTQSCSEESENSSPFMVEEALNEDIVEETVNEDIVEEAVNENSIVTFTVNAGENQYYKENAEVTLQGIYPNDINITSYLWEQVSGEPVEMTSKQTDTLQFNTPTITNGSTTTELAFSFTVTSEQNFKATDNVSIFIEKDVQPLEVNAGKDQIAESLSSVKLTGTTIGGNTENLSRTWYQKSGPEITLSNSLSASVNFTAPEVSQIEVIVLSYTVEDGKGTSSQDDVAISIIPKYPKISPHVLLFTMDRIHNVREKIITNSSAWDALTNKISNYFEKIPYNAGEYAGAFALAYYVSGDKKYIERAIELLNITYFKEPTIGWNSYQSRNLFRSQARWAIMGYSWIKDYISPQEKIRIENILKLWSEYWLVYIDYENDFEGLRVTDTDEVTSITKNITLLGYALSDSDIHHILGKQLLNVGDTLLERYVVGYYMKDIMKGGAWAEGSDYSPATQTHWIDTFLINKDKRGMEYPENYAKLAMESLLHQTLAGGTGVYKYGSEEDAVDYDKLSDDFRYELALRLMSILEDENSIILINQWFEKLISKEGFKSGSLVTHFNRLLFHDPTINKDLLANNLNTLHYAEGVGLIATRDSWEDTATNLYFINRSLRVDHEHKDALSFDIANNGVWITKESTGYSGASVSSLAHNTILIENAGDGSSSPTRRPAGTPEYHSIYNDDSVTLISADATKAYNMSGYFATDYAKQVSRQLAFIKPNIVIVYDRVITDESQIKDLINYSDLNLSEGMKHTRWVKIIQHVQAEPLIMEGLLNSYQVKNENRQLVYQVISPSNATVNIVNEKKLWEDSLQYELPENQRKWHFEISTDLVQQENEFITSLSFGNTDETLIADLQLNPIVMTKENSYILNGNITGVAIEVAQERYIILFKKDPKEVIENAKIKAPEMFENATIYTIGFDL